MRRRFRRKLKALPEEPIVSCAGSRSPPHWRQSGQASPVRKKGLVTNNVVRSRGQVEKGRKRQRKKGSVRRSRLLLCQQNGFFSSVRNATPLAQTGGLGDVVAGLSKALRKRGHDARVIMPLYGSIDRAQVRHYLFPLLLPSISAGARKSAVSIFRGQTRRRSAHLVHRLRARYFGPAHGIALQ